MAPTGYRRLMTVMSVSLANELEKHRHNLSFNKNFYSPLVPLNNSGISAADCPGRSSLG